MNKTKKDYLSAKRLGSNKRSRVDLSIKENDNSADFIAPNFATGCQAICTYCVAENTLIATPINQVPVQQIRDGDEVLTYDSLKDF